jgi:hypothetical protein
MKNKKLFILTILIAATFALISCNNKIIVFSQNNIESACEYYTVEMNGTSIHPERFREISYIHFELTKAIKVKVTCTEKINDYVISPVSKKIEGKKNGNELSFKISEPGYYVIKVNNKKYLFLLADSPQEKAYSATSKGILNVNDFLPHEKNKVLTISLQAALDAASVCKNVLYFPAGVYCTGTLAIKSNTSIYLDSGAIIKGSENRDDYPTDENRLESDLVNRPKVEYTDNGEFMTFSRLILIDNATNVHIFGRGIIDGSGSVVRAQGKPANLIRIRRSENILIEGIILRDPAAWNTHVQFSRNVTLRNIKIINDSEVPNTDGIDPDASRNVVIDHCFAYCNDDNIAIKTTNNLNLNQDLDSVTVKNCVFLTRKSSLKVGTETKAATMQNILFENNDVILCDRGMVLYLNDGTHIKNVQFINNRFENCYFKGQQRPIHFVIKDRSGKGNIENVLVKDCVFYNAFPKPSEILGLDETSLVKSILIDNLMIASKKVTSIENGNILINNYVTGIKIK